MTILTNLVKGFSYVPDDSTPLVDGLGGKSDFKAHVSIGMTNDERRNDMTASEAFR